MKTDYAELHMKEDKFNELWNKVVQSGFDSCLRKAATGTFCMMPEAYGEERMR
jgi:hypothetical protein